MGPGFYPVPIYIYDISYQNGMILLQICLLMSWVRCWHPSMRHLQWSLWWTAIWVGMRDEATLARPSSFCSAIASWHDGSFFWDAMMRKSPWRNLFDAVVWFGCFLRPDDHPDDWNTFFKLFLAPQEWMFDPRSWFRKAMRSVSKTSPILSLWLYDGPVHGWSQVSVADAWSFEVEIDGFFSLPHARESRFSSDSAKFWRGSSCCTDSTPPKQLENSTQFWKLPRVWNAKLQGKFWNLKYMNIQEILVHIQVSKLLLFAVEKTVGLVSVVWLGLEGALECQQQCAKTYRCEHLGCKDVVVIEVFRLERLWKLCLD